MKGLLIAFTIAFVLMSLSVLSFFWSEFKPISRPLPRFTASPTPKPFQTPKIDPTATPKPNLVPIPIHTYNPYIVTPPEWEF